MDKFEKSMEIQKSDDTNLYKFEGIASSYGNVDCYGDVFLDGSLNECIGKTVPIMVNHNWDITKCIGYGKLEKDGSKILIKGEFIDGDETSEKIVKLKSKGVPLKLSIGGVVKESRPYKKNGTTYRGITKADIFETSVVFRGANPKAQITKSDDCITKLNVIIDKLNKIYGG